MIRHNCKKKVWFINWIYFNHFRYICTYKELSLKKISLCFSKIEICQNSLAWLKSRPVIASKPKHNNPIVWLYSFLNDIFSFFNDSFISNKYIKCTTEHFWLDSLYSLTILNYIWGLWESTLRVHYIIFSFWAHRKTKLLQSLTL